MKQRTRRSAPTGEWRTARPADPRPEMPTRRVVLNVLDIRRPSIAAALKRQSLALRNDSADRDALVFIDRIADRSGWR